jgi:fructokinase
MDLICLGELLIDLFPAEVGRRLTEVSAFHPKPGGAPGNVAVAARRLGLTSAFIGKVGDDAFGRFLIDTLAATGVATDAIRIDDEARTTLAFIALPDPHHAEFVFYRNPGADTRLRPDELDEELLRHARALHVGSLSLVAEPSRSATLRAVEIARAAGALVSFGQLAPACGPAPTAVKRHPRTAAAADVIKVNEEELLLTGSDDLDAGGAALLPPGRRWWSSPRRARQRARRRFVPAAVRRSMPLAVEMRSGRRPGRCRWRGWRKQRLDDAHRPILRYANAVGALTATRGAAGADGGRVAFLVTSVD